MPDYMLLNVVKFLSEEDNFILYESCKTFSNLFKIPKILIRRRPPSMYNVVKSIRMIKWASSHKNFKFKSNSLQLAIRRNNLKVVKYLSNNGCKFNRYCYREAINNPDFEILKWMKKHKIEMSRDACAAASGNGYLKLLKWFREHGCPWDYCTVNSAAYSGNINTLKFAIANNCEWHSDAFNYACKSGNLNVVKCLYDESSHDLSKPWWDSSVCATAAEYGHLHILKFLKEKMCPWRIDTLYSALKNNNLEIFYWAIENGCPSNEYFDRIYQQRYISNN